MYRYIYIYIYIYINIYIYIYMEKETNKMLAFLDVCINNKDPCNLLMSVHRKKTFSGLLTNFFSFTSYS